MLDLEAPRMRGNPNFNNRPFLNSSMNAQRIGLVSSWESPSAILQIVESHFAHTKWLEK